MYANGDAKMINGGDGDKSQIILLPIKKLHEYIS